MFKEIIVFDTLIHIYNDGRVFDVIKQEFKKVFTNGRRGYLVYNFYYQGRVKRVMVSRLVAINFVPNPNNLPVVNHDDGDKSNNYYTNLIWDTHSGNMFHAIRNGLITKRRSPIDGRLVRRPVSRLSISGEVLDSHPSMAEAARTLAFPGKKMVSVANAISKVCSGKQQVAYGYKWKSEV